MRLSTYMTPDMTVLRQYLVLDQTPAGSVVRSFLFRPPEWDGKSAHAFITATPEGVIIQGPLVCGPDGHGFLSGKSLEWFLGVRTPEEVLSEFCSLSWQPCVATRDILTLARTTPPEVTLQLEELAARALLGQESETAVKKKLLDLGYTREVAQEVGWDYPVDDAGWLCAIQHYMALALLLN